MLFSDFIISDTESQNNEISKAVFLTQLDNKHLYQLHEFYIEKVFENNSITAVNAFEVTSPQLLPYLEKIILTPNS